MYVCMYVCMYTCMYIYIYSKRSRALTFESSWQLRLEEEAMQLRHEMSRAAEEEGEEEGEEEEVPVVESMLEPLEGGEDVS